MRFQRFFPHLVTVFSVVSVVSPASAAKYLLKQSPAPSTKATVQLEVRGNLEIAKSPPNAGEAESADATEENPNDKVKQLKLAVDGKLSYHERLLPDQQGRRSAVRHYSQSEAKVVVDGRLFAPRLKSDRRLVRVDVEGETVQYRSPQGPLSREELEVVAIQGNTLLLHRLLPDQEVAVGDSWGLDGPAVAPIFGLDAAYAADLQATLKAVSDEGIAQITFDGQLDGSVDGVSSQIDCEGDLEFNTKLRQITMFDVSFDESRKISGGQPGIRARSHLRVKIAKASIPTALQDTSIAQFPSDSAGQEVLRYTAPKGAFQLIHTPQWRVVRDSAKQTTVRLLDGGDVIAQGNLSQLKNLPEGNQLTLEGFEADVRKTLEKLQGQIAQTEETKLDSGLRMLRVIGQGQVEEIDVQWIYLHLSDDQGQRVSCVFTLEQKRAEQFQGAEVALLNGLQFTPKTAAKPAGTEAK